MPFQQQEVGNDVFDNEQFQGFVHQGFRALEGIDDQPYRNRRHSATKKYPLSRSSCENLLYRVMP
ncbi:MAG: hypothetical protein ACXWTL_06855 [Methylobacter sp.]